jgi:BolA family transcriptional regulator, general stress-responsive regulator
MQRDSDAGSRVERIRTVVQDRLHPIRLEIRDDSAAHAGHAGGGGKGHFHIRIVSEGFSGRSLVERHRMVHDALAALLETDIHALALVTKAPDEVL